MKTLLTLLIMSLSVAAAGQTAGATSCAGYSGSHPLLQIRVIDYTEHQDGNHSASTGVLNQYPSSQTINGICTYSSGTGSNCDTVCGVNNSIFSESDVGTLSALGSHMIGTGWSDGTAGGQGTGASCTGYFGVGVANCFLVGSTCVPSVTINAGVVSVQTGGRVIYQTAVAAANTCATQADPTKTSAGGGPPTNCLGGTGDPTSDSTFTGGGQTSPDCSPIIIDVLGEGFHLTSAAGGVTFDIRGDGHPIHIAWTAPGYHNAFLVLDRNNNGVIDSGLELFGNFTAQPKSPFQNGFLALAEFDRPENGGNGDGMIDERDAVFSRLRLWIDENHDGVSQANELHQLSEFGIYSLSLSYFESARTDSFGNRFRYRARVNPDRNHRDSRDETSSGEPGRWAYDVFLVTQ